MTILIRYWDTRITRTARIAAGREGVDPRTVKVAIGAFEQLRYDKSPGSRDDVQPIACTDGKLHRLKLVIHYRCIFAVVQQPGRTDGKRGTLLLLAVLPRNAHTYNPARLRQLIVDVIAEAKARRELKIA